jgi:hypothetical protein
LRLCIFSKYVDPAQTLKNVFAAVLYNFRTYGTTAQAMLAGTYQPR